VTARSTFTFDGFGINGPDEYRSRLATFTRAGYAYPGLGPLLEAAPDLAEALRGMVETFNTTAPDPLQAFAMIERAKAILDRVGEVAPPQQHVKVLHGLCRVCWHYGEDCTGKPV
jgi:hypothetical protein